MASQDREQQQEAKARGDEERLESRNLRDGSDSAQPLITHRGQSEVSRGSSAVFARGAGCARSARASCELARQAGWEPQGLPLPSVSYRLFVVCSWIAADGFTGTHRRSACPPARTSRSTHCDCEARRWCCTAPPVLVCCGCCVASCVPLCCVSVCCAPLLTLTRCALRFRAHSHTPLIAARGATTQTGRARATTMHAAARRFIRGAEVATTRAMEREEAMRHRRRAAHTTTAPRNAIDSLPHTRRAQPTRSCRSNGGPETGLGPRSDHGALGTTHAIRSERGASRRPDRFARWPINTAQGRQTSNTTPEDKHHEDNAAKIDRSDRTQQSSQIASLDRCARQIHKHLVALTQHQRTHLPDSHPALSRSMLRTMAQRAAVRTALLGARAAASNPAAIIVLPALPGGAWTAVPSALSAPAASSPLRFCRCFASSAPPPPPPPPQSSPSPIGRGVHGVIVPPSSFVPPPFMPDPFLEIPKPAREDPAPLPAGSGRAAAVLFATLVLSMFVGSQIVHAIYQPDVRIPDVGHKKIDAETGQVVVVAAPPPALTPEESAATAQSKRANPGRQRFVVGTQNADGTATAVKAVATNTTDSAAAASSASANQR